MTNIFDLPDDSLVRLKTIIGPGNPVPISKSTWFVWRKAGKAPQCTMLGARIAAYRVGDIKDFVSKTVRNVRLEEAQKSGGAL